MTKKEIKNNFRKLKLSPDAFMFCITVKGFLEELDKMPSSAQIDPGLIRFDILGNVYIDCDEWGFGGDWWMQ